MLCGDAWGAKGQKHGGNLSCCNETVMKSVTAGLEAQNIPYNWIQMDDWWYTGYFPTGGGRLLHARLDALAPCLPRRTRRGPNEGTLAALRTVLLR
jgi:hypothetical protein